MNPRVHNIQTRIGRCDLLTLNAFTQQLAKNGDVIGTISKHGERWSNNKTPGEWKSRKLAVADLIDKWGGTL
ncbi:MAG TPA: hypothetical protein VL381_00565 [Rhodocyclaceae bacterium]|nr:hypothetical protein [Rhodocyclaceae bacterium]